MKVMVSTDRISYVFKYEAPTVPAPHKEFSSKDELVSAKWKDVEGDLVETATVTLALSKEPVNQPDTPRTDPMWTLATINGFWVLVILDTGALQTLIGGYDDVLYMDKDKEDIEPIVFNRISGALTSKSCLSLAVSLRGQRKEYLTFRAFFWVVPFPKPLVILGNDVLSALKMQTLVQRPPLASFAVTLTNPDIIIPGSITEKVSTDHLIGRKVDTILGPMYKDVPPNQVRQTKASKATSPKVYAVAKDSTNSTSMTVEDVKTFFCESLTQKEATQLMTKYDLPDDVVRAPKPFRDQFLTKSFKIDLNQARPVVWMLLQILR